jgi:NlpC/P60 family putative phage cell wall peptidase
MPADPARVIAAARGWLGTPYHDQASAKGAGCDCLGLVRGVWRDLHGSEPEQPAGGLDDLPSLDGTHVVVGAQHLDEQCRHR